MFERVEMDPRMPREIQEIGIHYNQVMDQCVEAIDNELRTAQKLRNAEILALESQINPHFIYNTLDTISWMAIGKEDYEVSDAISAFAKILRYSCTDSNGVVTIREELAWLGQYLVLQKLRLENPWNVRWMCRRNCSPTGFTSCFCSPLWKMPCAMGSKAAPVPRNCGFPWRSRGRTCALTSGTTGWGCRRLWWRP